MGLSSKQVSVDSHNWSQGGLEFPKPERREEKQKVPLLKCPRCESTNTKFCYYNNYSRSQPRHFCRACRRHWTEGGTLRNIPVGGGRKNKRRKISPTATSSAGAAAGNSTVPVIKEMECPIFPDILRQVLLHPLPLESPTVDTTNGLFPTSLPNTSLTFMEDFNGMSPGFVLSEGKIPFTTAASSRSLSSQYSWREIQDVGGGCEDSLLGMDPSTASAWVKKETVFPASYLDFWDGGAADFNDADAVEPVFPQ